MGIYQSVMRFPIYRHNRIFLGRTVSQSRPGFGDSTLISSNLYNTVGQLTSTISLSTRSTCSIRLKHTHFLYDSLCNRVASIDDRNFNNAIDWTDPDLVSSNITHYVKLDGYWWRETKSYSIHDDNSAVARLMGVRLSRVTGLGANGLASETISIDQRGNATTNRVWRNRAAAEEVACVKYPTSTTPAVTTSTNGLVRSSTSQTGVTTTFAYDAFQREVSQTDGRGNTTRTVYDPLGRVASTIDALGYATAYGYDALGRQVSVTDPLTNTITTAYDAEGHVVSQRGATYPVDYAYDEFGEKVSMTTYRDINASGDVTRWLRDAATGLVTNKVYADGKGPTYTYTPDGKLETRIWARGIATTYSYDANGALTNTVYSDGTPTISLAYNRAGRQIEAHDAAGVTIFLYDGFGAVTNETVVGVAGTNTIERFYDNFGRDAGYALNGVRQSTLAYDPATGRLASMRVPSDQSTNPNNQAIKQFSWNYLAGTDLKSSLEYPNGLTASWVYDANNQLLQVCNATPTNTISQYDYAYDAGGRRIACAKSGSVFTQDDTVAYSYNSRSELTNAVAAVDSNYRYAYDFDDIGNRESSSERGTNSVYAANNLNQYTAITDVSAMPSSSQTFQPQFDDDGNQTLIKTSTGIWQVTYNGENRPVQWSNGSTSIVMSFDRMGRRVVKNAQRFVYDGYLQIANFELVSTNSQLTALNSQLFIWDPTEPVATRSLVWNASTLQPFNSSTSYYTHDGNKNVSEVVARENDVSAHYVFAPFGAVNNMSGGSALANPWRFSNEFADNGLGLEYYNYRNYIHDVGVWISQDRLVGQFGGSSYNFCFNNPYSYIDVRGDHPALLLLIPLILLNPSVANAPGVGDETTTSLGAAGMIVDLVGGRVLSGTLKCCGKILGSIRFKVYSCRARSAVATSLPKYAGKSVVVGSFDARTGKVVVESSGKYIEKPTPVLEAIADELGGVGTARCGNVIGCCAEFHAADELISKGSVLTDIRFVEAIRPRNNVVIKPCDNCLQMFKYNFNSKSIPVNTPEIYFVPVSRLVDDE